MPLPSNLTMLRSFLGAVNYNIIVVSFRICNLLGNLLTNFSNKIPLGIGLVNVKSHSINSNEFFNLNYYSHITTLSTKLLSQLILQTMTLALASSINSQIIQSKLFATLVALSLKLRKSTARSKKKV